MLFNDLLSSPIFSITNILNALYSAWFASIHNVNCVAGASTRFIIYSRFIPLKLSSDTIIYCLSFLCNMSLLTICVNDRTSQASVSI